MSHHTDKSRQHVSRRDDKKQRLCNAGQFLSEAKRQYEVLQDDQNDREVLNRKYQETELNQREIGER